MTPLTEFFDAYDIWRPQVPTPPSRATVQRCTALIKEEHREVMVELRTLELGSEIGVSMEDRLATLGRLLKELCDLRYVVEYAAVICGLDIDAAYAEVHQANMSKLGADGQPIRREDGKILKGPFYREPDMEPFIHVAEEAWDAHA
jgi:predicted HAD superfamily Cof-like phosphohydrolase